ncbi:MAG: HAMP domain-containing protein, partial [Thiotrichales bacterium]|nr:HAMP domain-containing protein [Thiotrichales bacterium]
MMDKFSITLTTILAAVGVIATTAAFILLAISTNDPDTIGSLFPYIVFSSAVGLSILFYTIAINIYRLVRKFIAGESGARLHFRFVGIFVSLALIPIIIISLFTSQIMKQQDRGEEEVQHLLEGSQELYKTALNERKKRLLEKLYQLSGSINGTPTSMIDLILESARDDSNARELILYDINGKQIGFSSMLSEPTLAPEPLDSFISNLIHQGVEYIKVKDNKDAEQYGQLLHIVVPLHSAAIDGGESRILSAYFSIPKPLVIGQEKIDDAVMRNKRRLYLEDQRNTVHNIAFILLLLLSLLTALWFAFYSTRRLTSPIIDLAKGTQSVAAGIYNQPLQQSSKDDLGFLVQAFNDMMLNLDHTHSNLKQSQQQIEHQKARLEGILSNISSGVIVLDPKRRVERINAAACNILESKISPAPGLPIGAMSQHNALAEPLVNEIRDHIQGGKQEWSTSVSINSSHGVRHLFCRGSHLLNLGLKQKPTHIDGYVVVFDDITELVSAQKNAAWSEVARRLAHEIKNPLTPIQLSADRLRHRYLSKMDEEEGAVLNRATNTIIQQVDTLKRMVQAFSDYARAPELKLVPISPVKLLEEVTELFRAQHPEYVELQINDNLPVIELDRDRMRQILNNLIKNGLESLGENAVANVKISAVVTTSENEGSDPSLLIKICDNGNGIPDELKGEIFEPYATTKPKGTGLGLAIVKRIIEEHNGEIKLTTNKQGSCFEILLPYNNSDDN